MGDGGGCHPRDNIALSWLARKLDLSHDFFEDLMVAREDQTEWFADLIENYDLPKFILGKAFKPETNLTVGSPAVLLKNILEERGISVTCYDPHVDLDKPKFTKAVYFIGTRHDIFATYKFPAGSVVLDPHRYIPDQDDVTVIRIGQSKK
jgi:UDPglucose 6-dehydrogenase